MCVRDALAPDRSNELIYEWDSIHLDGVSWDSPEDASSICVNELLRIGRAVREVRQSNT
jgi:hypothetical protein